MSNNILKMLLLAVSINFIHGCNKNVEYPLRNCYTYRSLSLSDFDKLYHVSSEKSGDLICDAGILPSQLKLIVDQFKEIGNFSDRRKESFSERYVLYPFSFYKEGKRVNVSSKAELLQNWHLIFDTKVVKLLEKNNQLMDWHPSAHDRGVEIENGAIWILSDGIGGAKLAVVDKTIMKD